MLRSREVVERYFAARGGRAALESLKVVLREGEITFFSPEGEHSGLYRTRVSYPDTALIEIAAGPVLVLEGIVRGRAYRFDRSAECWVEAPERAEALLDTAQRANRELLFEEQIWGNASLERSGELWVLRGREVEEDSVTYQFSSEGLLLFKQRGERARRYSDWRDVGGIRFPFGIEDFVCERTVQRIRLSRVEQGVVPDDDWRGLLDVAH